MILTDSLRILDIGCGAGFFSIILSQFGHTVMAIDITPKYD
ncbi:MAG: class I SAM-dependent methyltransferase [Veillonella sp.]